MAFRSFLFLICRFAYGQVYFTGKTVFILCFSSEDFIYFPVIKTIIYMNSGFGQRPYLSDIDIYGSAVKYPQYSGKIFRGNIPGRGVYLFCRLYDIIMPNVPNYE